jgi:Flp pilus assembly pilin Flp
MIEPTTLRDEAGQTMAEYAVVLGVIGFITVAAFGALTGAIAEAFGAAAELINSIV